MDFLLTQMTARARASVLLREKSRSALLECSAKRYIPFFPGHISAKNRTFLFLYVVRQLPKYSKLLSKHQCIMSLERMIDHFSILFWGTVLPVSLKVATEDEEHTLHEEHTLC